VLDARTGELETRTITDRPSSVFDWLGRLP
jgi:hypothetical protein